VKILLVTKELGYRGTPKVLAEYARILGSGNEICVWGWQTGGEVAKILCDEGFNVLVGQESESVAFDFRPDIVNIHRHGARDDYETSVLKEFKSKGAICIETNVFGRLDCAVSRYLDVSIQISKWDLFQWNCWGLDKFVKGVYCPNPVDTGNFARASLKKISEMRERWGVPSRGKSGKKSIVLGRIGNTSWKVLEKPLLCALQNIPELYFIHVRDHSDNVPANIRSHERFVAIPRRVGIEELTSFYSSCDACVSMSAIGESFGMVNVEAMACGTPVIALSAPFHCNAVLETVGMSRGGIVVASPELLADVIWQISNNESVGVIDMAQARRYIEKEYSLDAVRERLMFIFNTTCNIVSSENKGCHDGKHDLLVDKISKEDMSKLFSTVCGSESLVKKLLFAIYYSRIGYKIFSFAKNSGILKLFKLVSRL